MLVPRQSTLKGRDEAVRIDEAHDQFLDLHPAEQGAKTALSVTGRIDLDLHEPSAEPFASQLPPLACTPIVPRVQCEDGAARRTEARGTSTLKSPMRSRSSPAPISIRPPAGPPPSRLSAQVEIGPMPS